MSEPTCAYCDGVRIVGWSSGAGPIPCPTCSSGAEVFTVLTVAWSEQRSKVVELTAKMSIIDSFIEQNGCDCPCDCASDEHDNECERCLGCRIEMVLRGAL